MATTMTHNELARLFADEDAAREHLEKLRWANGIVCPHCGVKDQATKLEPREDSKRPVRKGVYKCRACRKQFTVTVGTIFHRSHIPLNVWLHVFHLVCSSKKGMSAHQIHRMTGITYKSAWFMVHRIREAMTPNAPEAKLTGTIEVDETYVGGKLQSGKGSGHANKTPVVLVVQRDGESRATRMDDVKGDTVKDYIYKHVDDNAIINTDSYRIYRNLGAEYAGHFTVDHTKKEYARNGVHVNTAESWFSLLKRGVIGTFHHVSPKHLDRYAQEFAFRWNYRKVNDYERTIAAIRVVGGKRLMYKHLIE